MADYQATARTNYFRVKDQAAFNAALPGDITVQRGQDDRIALFADGDHGCWPTEYWPDDADDAVEIDWPALFAEHLVDGQVVVIIEAGAERQRFVGGWAQAIHSSGKSVSICLDDIYALAEKELGVGQHNITKACW